MHNCPICDRLWQEYSDATMSHIRIEGKQRIATIQQDSEALKIINPLLDNATEQRERAHNVLELHQDSHGIRRKAA